MAIINAPGNSALENEFKVLSVKLEQFILVTGVQAIGYVGNASVTGSATIYLTGVQATGIIGQVLVWGQIPDGSNPNWSPVEGQQSTSWTQITDNAATEWEPIAA